MKATRITRFAVLAGVASLVTASSALGSPARRADSTSCSKATALEVATRLQVGADPSLPNPIAGVLCGAFAGPGSQVMIATLARGTCLPNFGWAAFRLAGGDWQLVMRRNGFGIVSKAGSDIREEVPVFRSGDSPCFPSGGKKARTWRWNGSRLVAGPWRQVTPADTLKSGSFKTPSSNIVCDYFIHIGSRASESSIGCVVKSGLRPAPPRRPCQEGGYAGDRVYLGMTGAVQVPSCAGDPGPYVSVDRARVLGYGKTWSGGGFRCASADVGLTCRSKSGHGFFLSRERWRSF